MVDQEIESHDPATALFAKLEGLGIATHTVSHPPVFTVEQAKRHRVDDRGVHVKNLFLRNKKGSMWLVTTSEDRPVDLKELAAKIGAGHVSFGSPDRLRQHLGVEPGSVTPFAVLHDETRVVTSVIERSLLESTAVHCHPLTNDRTTSLSGPDLLRFLEATGHLPTVLDS
ncbi:MAG: prolyl-tRNA synthetase associated domain-containing protein [Polyangiaceae bacterium]|nr:prolyl-tRNA synthetase associated domain-containing protein [Polyangiaceae bacterium]